MDGILFKSEMTQAIKEGRKTVTRRVIKPQPQRINNDYDGTWEWKIAGHYYDDLTLFCTLTDNARYEVGEVVYIKEGHYRFGHWCDTGGETENGRTEYEFIPESNTVLYLENPPFIIQRQNRLRKYNLV